MREAYSDPYEVLQIERTADAAMIKQAYFALVRTYPPERDPAMFKRIRAAYEQVRVEEKRLETDMLLLQPWSATSRRRRTPELALELHADDILTAARELTDLGRTDWREHHGKIKG